MTQQSAYNIIISVIVIALSSYVSFDLPAVAESIPITGQSLAVMVCCIFLTPLEAGLAIIAYLILGGLGLPIFADGSSGWKKFSGGSGGFLYGFLIAGVLISFLGLKGYRNTFYKALFAMLLSTLVLLLIGNFYLSLKYGWAIALEYGFIPFWKGAVVKAFFGASVIVLLEKLFFKFK